MVRLGGRFRGEDERQSRRSRLGSRPEDSMTALHGSLVILLHGVGSSGRDLAPLAAELRDALPHSLFVAPDAPNRFDQGPGRQWFSVAGITAANRSQRIAEARAGFDATITEQIDHASLSGEVGRVALVGFSQGSIMALDGLATGRWPVAGVIAFSGRLATPDPLAPVEGAKALLIHGEVDPVIPAGETLDAAARLRRAGVAIETHVEPGLGHAISPRGVALARRFLIDALAP